MFWDHQMQNFHSKQQGGCPLATTKNHIHLDLDPNKLDKSVTTIYFVVCHLTVSLQYNCKRRLSLSLHNVLCRHLWHFLKVAKLWHLSSKMLFLIIWACIFNSIHVCLGLAKLIFSFLSPVHTSFSCRVSIHYWDFQKKSANFRLKKQALCYK